MALTSELKAALRLVDIKVLDHFIVAGADTRFLLPSENPVITPTGQPGRLMPSLTSGNMIET